jgi:hypothetical protein
MTWSVANSTRKQDRQHSNHAREMLQPAPAPVFQQLGCAYRRQSARRWTTSHAPIVHSDMHRAALPQWPQPNTLLGSLQLRQTLGHDYSQQSKIALNKSRNRSASATRPTMHVRADSTADATRTAQAAEDPLNGELNRERIRQTAQNLGT